MSVEKHFQLIIDNISSLENSLNDLQNHANNLHDASQINFATDFGPDAEVHPEFSNQLENMKSHVMAKSQNLENIISTALNPEQIQRKMDIMMKVQNRMDYYNRGGR